MATGTGPFRYYESDEIDGKSTGTYDLETTVVEGGFTRTFCPFGAFVIITDVSGLVTPSVISIGTNASSYNNIVSASAVGAILDAVKLYSLSTDLEQIGEGVDIKVKVTVAAIGTTCKFKVTVFGYDKLTA